MRIEMTREAFREMYGLEIGSDVKELHIFGAHAIGWPEAETIVFVDGESELLGNLPSLSRIEDGNLLGDNRLDVEELERLYNL